MGYSYKLYLKSEAWKLKRLQKLNSVGHSCQLCNSTDKLQIHHRTYERVYNEDLNDLTVLCSKCHYKFHKKRKK